MPPATIKQLAADATLDPADGGPSSPSTCTSFLDVTVNGNPMRICLYNR